MLRQPFLRQGPPAKSMLQCACTFRFPFPGSISSFHFQLFHKLITSDNKYNGFSNTLYINFEFSIPYNKMRKYRYPIVASGMGLIGVIGHSSDLEEYPEPLSGPQKLFSNHRLCSPAQSSLQGLTIKQLD